MSASSDDEDTPVAPPQLSSTIVLNAAINDIAEEQGSDDAEKKVGI